MLQLRLLSHIWALKIRFPGYLLCRLLTLWPLRTTAYFGPEEHPTIQNLGWGSLREKLDNLLKNQYIPYIQHSQGHLPIGPETCISLHIRFCLRKTLR